MAALRAPLAAWAGRLALALAAVALRPAPARADRGDLGAQARLLWPGGGRAGAALSGSLGLADAWAAALEVGGQVACAGAARPAGHLVAGATWLWDVTRWVPSATLAPGIEVGPGGRLHPAALARLELRFFARPRWTLHASAGARWGRRGVAPELGVAVGWAG